MLQTEMFKGVCPRMRIGKFSIEVLNQMKPLAVLRKKHIFAISKDYKERNEYEYNNAG